MAITAVHLSFKSPFLKCLSRTLNLSPIVEVSKPWSSCMTWKRKNGEKITFLNNFHPIPQFSFLHKGQKNKEILLCFCKRREVLWDEVRQKFHYLNVKIQIWWQMKKRFININFSKMNYHCKEKISRLMIVGALWESHHFVYHTLASVAKLRHHRRQHHQFSSYYQIGTVSQIWSKTDFDQLED